MFFSGARPESSIATGLVAVSGSRDGSYTKRALEHVRSTVRGIHRVVVPRQVGIRNARQRFTDSEVTDEGIGDRLDGLAVRSSTAPSGSVGASRAETTREPEGQTVV